jgi:hypothetical protein
MQDPAQVNYFFQFCLFWSFQFNLMQQTSPYKTLALLDPNDNYHCLTIDCEYTQNKIHM